MDQKSSIWKYFFGVIALVVIAVLVALVLQQQQQLKTLKGTETKTETSQENTNTESSNEPIVEGERQIISTPYSQLTGKCDLKVNTDPANSTELFSDKTLGFEVSLPYNENWGTEQYKISPSEYDAENNRLLYGPIGPGEGCGWGRKSIAVMKPQSEAEAIAEIKKNFGDSFSFGPEAVTVDGLKLIRYSANGICTFQGVVVLGKRHAYGFSTCSDNRNDAYQEFNKIIATLKSI